jgi:transcriptional regulator with XRE-family HTH domain
MQSADQLQRRLGQNVRERREALAISQHELGFRAETHPNAISPLELGHTLPRIETFIRLAGALEVTADELSAGILWTPGEAVVLPGDFEVPSDPELAAQAEALREVRPTRRRHR